MSATSGCICMEVQNEAAFKALHGVDGLRLVADLGRLGSKGDLEHRLAHEADGEIP